MCATDNEGNQDPEGEEPREGNAPGDGSVVVLLDEPFLGLDVSEEPPDAEAPENWSNSILHNVPGVPFTSSEPKDSPVIIMLHGFNNLEHNNWKCAEEKPEKSKPNCLQFKVLVEVTIVVHFCCEIG